MLTNWNCSWPPNLQAKYLSLIMILSVLKERRQADWKEVGSCRCYVSGLFGLLQFYTSLFYTYIVFKITVHEKWLTVHSHVWEGLYREETRIGGMETITRGQNLQRVEKHVRSAIPWELGIFIWSGRSGVQQVMTSGVWGSDSVPVRANKHRDAFPRQKCWPYEARAKGLEGINKTAGSLNNVRQQFKQAHRHIRCR